MASFETRAIGRVESALRDPERSCDLSHSGVLPRLVCTAASSAANFRSLPVEPRIKDPFGLLPNVLPALLAVDKATANDDVPLTTRQLVHLRASQINN